VELNNEFRVAVPAATTWQVLTDVNRVAPCIPGAQLLSVDGDDFTGTVKVKIGPISLTYKGKASYLEKDEAGHRASFRVLLFTDEFRWRLSSYESLEQLAEPSFTTEMKNVLNKAKEIIAVGASSEEIVQGLSTEAGRKREEARAARRAERIAMWVRAALSSPIPVRKLNVGHHMPTKGFKETSDQRRVIIILVIEREEGTNVDQALRQAMALESVKAPIFEALLTRYSLSANKAFTWVE